MKAKKASVKYKFVLLANSNQSVGKSWLCFGYIYIYITPAFLHFLNLPVIFTGKHDGTILLSQVPVLFAMCFVYILYRTTTINHERYKLHKILDRINSIFILLKLALFLLYLVSLLNSDAVRAPSSKLSWTQPMSSKFDDGKMFANNSVFIES